MINVYVSLRHQILMLILISFEELEALPTSFHPSLCRFLRESGFLNLPLHGKDFSALRRAQATVFASSLSRPPKHHSG